MFAAPAFLLGLLAIGVPLWLHRIARADPTRHPFASLMFLKRSEALRTSRRTLRYWLLLALRILLLIALVLAFAGPLLPEETVSRVASTKLHAVVIDRSLSMQYGDRWEQAIDRAEEIINSVPANDQILLASASGRRVQVVHGPVRGNERSAVRAALQQLKPGLSRLDYGFLMGTANGWLGAQRPPTELYVVTDLQQSATPLQFADLEPPENTHLNIIEIAGEDVSNTFVQDVTFAQSNSSAVAARIHAAGKPAAREAVLWIDGTAVERKPIELDAAGQQTIEFSARELGRGAHRVEVRLTPEDALPVDDRYAVVIEQSNPAVLLVAQNTNADEVAYLAAAVESLPTPRLDVHRITSSELPSRSLSRYAAVVISDSATLPDTARKLVREYANAGGAVFVTLGSQITTPTNEAVTGIDLRDVSTESSRVSLVQESHPILRDADPWRGIRFFRHVRVQAAEKDKTLLSLEDGAPLLIERSMGQGRLLLLTAPLQREWSDLATHPLFVRFIGDAVVYLTASNAWPMSATVDQGIATGLTASSGGQIFDPDGERIVSLEARGDFSRLIPDRPGFYEIRRAEDVKWLAVNVDARESNLSRMPEDSVQRWLRLRPDAMSSSAAATPAPVQSDARRSIGWWVLILAAVLLVLEFLLGNHYLAVRREVAT